MAFRRRRRGSKGRRRSFKKRRGSTARRKSGRQRIGYRM